MGRKVDPKIITYTRVDGSVSYRVRVRAHGKQTTETFSALVAAETFVRRVKDPQIGPERAVEMRDHEDRNHPDYVPTVAELLPKYVEQITGVEDATREEYLRLAARSWLEHVGSMRVDDPGLRDDVARRWLNTTTAAPKTIKNQKSVLLGVMDYAVAKGYVLANPLVRMRITRSGEEDAEDPRFLTHAEFDTLFAEFAERDRPIVAWMFGMGTRWGETSAVLRRDIDLDAGQWDGDTWTAAPRVQIVRAWKKAAKGTARRIGQPKSRASRRPVIIPDEVVSVIEPLLTNLAADDYLFRTATGKPISHSNFYSRAWRPAVMRASVCPDHRPARCRCFASKPWLCTVHAERDGGGDRIGPPPCGCAGRLSFRPRIHDARHTHASWLIAQGVPLEVVQERLGHEDFLTTRRLYAHLLPDAQLKAQRAASLAFARTALARVESPRELG